MVTRLRVFGDGIRIIESGELIIYKRWIERRPIKVGEMVELIDETEEAMACGLYDRIGVRILSFSECPDSVSELLREKVETARRIRERMGYMNVFRLINGDGDIFPGLIVDVYEDLAVLQSSSAAVDVHISTIASLLKDILNIRTAVEKSVQRVRSKAGLKPIERTIFGNQKSKVVTVDVEGLKYKVDVRGRKTGLYLDQRENRVFIKRFVRGESFLDLFSYTGGFGLNALAGGAKRVTFVDNDAQALATLKENIRLNNFDIGYVEIVNADAFKYLKRILNKREYGVSSIDPPALMDDYPNGYTLYRTVYSLASLVTSHILVPSSCSRSMSKDLFLRNIYESIRENYRVLDIRGSSPDHPFRRGMEDYLKTAFIALE